MKLSATLRCLLVSGAMTAGCVTAAADTPTMADIDFHEAGGHGA